MLRILDNSLENTLIRSSTSHPVRSAPVQSSFSMTFYFPDLPKVPMIVPGITESPCLTVTGLLMKTSWLVSLENRSLIIRLRASVTLSTLPMRDFSFTIFICSMRASGCSRESDITWPQKASRHCLAAISLSSFEAINRDQCCTNISCSNFMAA